MAEQEKKRSEQHTDRKESVGSGVKDESEVMNHISRGASGTSCRNNRSSVIDLLA